MGPPAMRIDTPCPACGEGSLDYSSTPLDIPYFPHAVQLAFQCQACGFRHSDFLLGTAGDPKRHTYAVRSGDDMMVRVVRSTSGTIRIPELGVLIEPGPASDAYVSNIEGVLARVGAVIVQLARDAESPEQRTACEERLADIARAREGKLPFTFILEDPFGNSAVAHEAARVEALSAEEATNLKAGAYTLELGELARRKPDGNGAPTP